MPPIKELVFDLPLMRDLSPRNATETTTVLNNKAVQVGLGVMPIWWATNVVQPFLTWGLAEMSQNIPIETLGASSLLFYGGTMAASMTLEAKTLTEKGFSGNILSSILYSSIKNPTLAVSLSAMAGLVIGNNLVDLAGVASLGSGDGRFFFTNFEVKTAIGFGLSSFINLAILSGKIEPLLGYINHIYETLASVEMPVYADSINLREEPLAQTIFMLQAGVIT